MANPPTKRVYALHKRKKKNSTKRSRSNSSTSRNQMISQDQIEIKKGRWSPDEDEKLLALVKTQQHEHGIDHEISWDQVEQLFKTRSKKQCRERWLSQLDPTLNKKEWTGEEDQVLLQLSAELNKRWAEIARKIPGRTENMVKNRWHALHRQSNGATPKRKRTSKSNNNNNNDNNNVPRKQQITSVSQQVVYPLSVVKDQSNKNNNKNQVRTPNKIVESRKTMSLLDSTTSTSTTTRNNSNEGFLFTKTFGPVGPAEPLARIPSFESRRSHLMLDRQNSLEIRGHPFGDKPDVLQRNPSFDLLKENSIDMSSSNNLFWNQQLQRNNSLALLEKQLSLTDIPKSGAVTPTPFLGGSSGTVELSKQHSLDLGKIGKRQVSYGVSSVAESTIEQIFLDEEPVDVGALML